MAKPQTPRPDRRTTVLLPDGQDRRPDGSSLWRAAAASRVLLIGIAGCVALLIVIAIALAVSGGSGGKPAPRDGQGSSPGADGRGEDSNVSRPGTGARAVRSGVPVGYERSPAGAVSAAINYELARTRPDYFTDAQVRRNVLTVVMTGSALPSQLNSDNDNAAKVMAQLGLRPGGKGPGASVFIARGAPLGTRMTSYSDQVATVEVWMAQVTGVTDTSSALPPTAAWDTYTLTLVWQDGDWKITSLTATPGPTPVSGGQNPTSANEWQSRGAFDAPPPVS